MQEVLIVVAIIALGAFAALCFYLIAVVGRIRNVLVVVEHDVKEISARAIPVMENLEVITEKVKNVTETIDEQMDIIKTAVSSIKGIADNVVDFERRIQDRIEEPVLQTVGTAAAIIKGVRTFFTKLREEHPATV
jgi:uncharacterized protein YoxC